MSGWDDIGGVPDKLVAVFSSGRIVGHAIDSDVSYPGIFDAHVHAAVVDQLHNAQICSATIRSASR